MKKKIADFLRYAIWIDQKKAVIASMNSRGQISTESLNSSIENHVRFAGETSNRNRLFAGALNQEKHTRNHLQHLRTSFVKDVAAHLNNAGTVIIMGPAEIKYELHKVLEKSKRSTPVWIVVRSADKMKVHEIKAVLKESARV